jgi:isopentenyl-diphosphate delta-isomerase
MTDRKKEHIELTQEAQIKTALLDNRFYYEPMLSAHPNRESQEFDFLRKKLKTPIWVSSMTGGTELAAKINRNLAKACVEFGMGMGLGSCRSLLHSKQNFEDFNVRPIIGPDLPLYANLGICQIEELIQQKALDKIEQLVTHLDADGLIVHINPMQELLQPEGDHLVISPLETLTDLLQEVNFPIIVKEVGQGFGPNSLFELLKLPIQAIELAAFGGTNFAKMELLRNKNQDIDLLEPLAKIGHSTEQMIEWINHYQEKHSNQIQCKEIIISGGIQTFMDGYFSMQKCKMPSIYGQASALLNHAKNSYEELKNYLMLQKKGLAIASSYLQVKNN